ncbi:MAG: peptidoglycan editing factor PgeF [Pseudomonadota bacterium]
MPENTGLASDVVTSPLLQGAPHGFLGRGGGFSEGIYRGLNVGLGSDDDRDTILKNRQRAKESILPGSHLVTLHQVHSADVVTVDRAFDISDRPHADAIVTNEPGLLLGILTADCVPVLFHDASAGVIGAAHAGWKGAIAGVTDNTLENMEKLGAERKNIACAIGPCIAQQSYEVDVGFRQKFLDVSSDNKQFFISGKPGHFQFDIEAFVGRRLEQAGITHIHKLGLDTYAAADRYYSYRRSCHLGEPGYGRQISLIGLGE